MQVIATDGLKPVAASPTTRAIAPAVRRFVLFRDSDCVIDGCASRYRLQPHHVIPRSEGGSHDPSQPGHSVLVSPPRRHPRHRIPPRPQSRHSNADTSSLQPADPTSEPAIPQADGWIAAGELAPPSQTSQWIPVAAEAPSRTTPQAAEQLMVKAVERRSEHFRMSSRAVLSVVPLQGHA